MRKIVLVCLLTTFIGCAWANQQVDYMKLCAQDPSCESEAKKDSELVKSIVGIAYPIAAGGCGAVIYSLSLWIKGRKKAKEVK